MERNDDPRPAPASRSLLRPIAGEAHPSSSSSSSHSSASSPDFLRQIHATLKRRRLLTMPARAVRVPVSQTQPPKSGAAVPPQTGSNAGKHMCQRRVPIGVTRFSKERDAEMGMNTRDDSWLTPPSLSGTLTGVHEESMQMDYLDGDKEDAGLLGHQKETTLASFSSALLESEVVPVGDWQKKAQFSSGLGCNLSFHSAIAQMTTDIGLDGIASYLHSLALKEGDNISVNRITTNEQGVNQTCSQNIDVSSSEIPFGRAFEDREEERHKQHCMEPATQSELVRSSCVTTMSIHSGPRSQSVNAPLSGQDTFPTHVSTFAAQDLCVKGHAVSETQGAVTKEGSLIDDNQSGSHLREDIMVKSVITNACCLQPRVHSTSNLTSNAVMEVPKSSKAKNAHQKKKYDPDIFVKVNGKLYQKLGKIGSGGSSEVHKVISAECNIYALKIIKLKGRDYATAYGFCQEIEYLNKLKGRSNIIQLIDYEVSYKALLKEAKVGSMTSKDGRIKDDEHIYMVLEFGEIDLAHMLSQKWKGMMDSSSCKLDDNWLRFYWQQMLEAVNTIHEERIVHSDLKPANFLLVRGSLKLIDFGIAKAIMSDTTNIQRDAQVGTLNYMSPESFMWNEENESGGTIKCGRPSDIWSLGCILYQMVYGETPFAGYKTFWAKFKVITDRNYEITYKRVANPSLIDLMKRCLAWDCRDRLRIPQLLQHPFLLPPPLMTKELPSSEDSSPELLFQRVALFLDNPEVSMLCSELQNIISKLEKDRDQSIN